MPKNIGSEWDHHLMWLHAFTWVLHLPLAGTKMREEWKKSTVVKIPHWVFALHFLANIILSRCLLHKTWCASKDHAIFHQTTQLHWWPLLTLTRDLDFNQMVLDLNFWWWYRTQSYSMVDVTSSALAHLSKIWNIVYLDMIIKVAPRQHCPCSALWE